MLHKTRKKLRSGIFMLGALAVVHTWAATTTPAVHGSVTDDTGKPVAGARVLIASSLPATARRIAAPPVITGPLAATMTADSNGAFSVAALSDGQYIACAETAAPGLLDPCHWSTSAPAFTMSAGTTAGDVKIVMARGAVVPIHIDDPRGLLKAVTGPIDFDLQIHAVTGRGFHYNANLQASSPLSRDQAVTVPFGVPVSIHVLSTRFVVNDQSGNQVSAEGMTVAAASGTSLPAIDLVVAGRK